MSSTLISGSMSATMNSMSVLWPCSPCWHVPSRATPRLRPYIRREEGKDLHAGSASRHAATLLHAFELALAGVLGLALHVVIVIGAAPGADEEGCREKGRGGGADLLDLGHGVGEGGGVHKDLLVEAASTSLAWGVFSPTGGQSREGALFSVAIGANWQRSAGIEQLGNVHGLPGRHVCGVVGLFGWMLCRRCGGEFRASFEPRLVLGSVGDGSAAPKQRLEIEITDWLQPQWGFSDPSSCGCGISGYG